MEYQRCLRNTIYKVKSEYHNSETNQLQIKFKICFCKITSNWNILQQDYTTAQFTGSSSCRKNLVVPIDVQIPAGSESLKCHDLRVPIDENLGAAIGNCIRNSQLKKFLNSVHEKVSARFKTTGEELPRHGVLSFDCCIITEHKHYYNYEVENNGGRMVRAVESSIESLEKCEDDEQGCCSICLDELSLSGGGGVALRMPCLHVFHGCCIREWLRTSHYCPLCRHEMPVEE